MMLISLAQLAYLVHRAHTGHGTLHAADMISVMPSEKRARIWRLALCGVLLLLIIVRRAHASCALTRSGLTRRTAAQARRGRDKVGHGSAGCLQRPRQRHAPDAHHASAHACGPVLINARFYPHEPPAHRLVALGCVAALVFARRCAAYAASM